MRAELQNRVVGRAGHLALDLLFRTISFDIVGGEHVERLREAGSACIYALWHGRLLPAMFHHRGQGVTALVSRSRDGEYIARVLEHWGYATVRGSSSRGGSTALRAIIRAARSGNAIAVTPDGPRGPRHKLKPGVLAAAQATGLPLVPVATGADRAWWFESWDRFLVPKPFSRVRIAYGEPQLVPRGAGPEEIRAGAERLERELNRLVGVVDGDSRG